MPIATSDDPQGSGLFADIHFTVIPTGNLGGQTERKIITQLEDRGAVYRPVNLTTGRIQELPNLTHIIATTSDFPEYFDALDQFIHVVKPSWVEISILKERVSNPRQFSPDPALFLSEVIVTCADIPEADQDAIYAGILAAGGQSSTHLTKLVTHIVALSTDNEICKVALSKSLGCKIVLPHWFDDCMKLGKKISEHPYILPDPEIFNKDSTDPIRYNENRDLHGASIVADSDTPVPTSSANRPRRALSVFNGRVACFSSDLDLSDHLNTTLRELIRDGGGDVTEFVADADMCVCRYRDGRDYVTASELGIDVGNLTWLYYVIMHNTWTSPFRRLLHYPTPRKGIPDFKDLRISLSNYTGEARVYLESLVRAAGAEFTKTMKPDNTHLITAHLNSEKCDAAKEWNVNLVNHLWLEESYAKCKMQTLTNPRYTHFPPRTNMGEVVGQTQIDREAVKRIGAQPEVTAQVSVRVQGRGATRTTAQQSGEPVKRADKVPATRTPVTVRSRLPSGKENETPSSTGSRSAKERAAQKLHDLAPDMQLYEKESKRVGGVVYGGRKVSDTDRVNIYGNGKANGTGKHGVVAGPGRKRSLSNADGDEDGKEPVADKDPGRKIKKVKSGDVSGLLPPVTHFLILSGFEGWVDKPRQEASDRAQLRAVGVEITQEPFKATVLAAPSIKRTVKFVASIPTVAHVVDVSYLEACLAASATAASAITTKGTKTSKATKGPTSKEDPDNLPGDRTDPDALVPNPLNFPLRDPLGEQRLGCELREVLQRVRALRAKGRRLLTGWRLWCSDTVKGGYDEYATIITANGGECQLFRGRKGVVNRASGPAGDVADEKESGSEEASPDAADGDHGDKEKGVADISSYAYLITRGGAEQDAEERALHERFKAQAEKIGVGCRIVTSEWLLHVAMCQELVWNDEYLVQDG